MSDEGKLYKVDLYHGDCVIFSNRLDEANLDEVVEAVTNGTSFCVRNFSDLLLAVSAGYCTAVTAEELH